MKRLARSTPVLCVFLGALALAAPARAQTRPPIVEELAKTYGLDGWGKIDAIRYTFNAVRPGMKVSRSWICDPKTGEVTYETKDKDGKPVKVTYNRSQLDRAPADVRETIDADFLNDDYQLLFPLHVYWDTDANVQDLGTQPLPIGKGSARKVVVKYPSDGGYTPGDTWDLYLGPHDRIVAFQYHRGAPTPPPSLETSKWAGYQKAGPLLISTDRRGTSDGKLLHIFFTHVAVKLAGSDKWVNAR